MRRTAETTLNVKLHLCVFTLQHIVGQHCLSFKFWNLQTNHKIPHPPPPLSSVLAVHAQYFTHTKIDAHTGLQSNWTQAMAAILQPLFEIKKTNLVACNAKLVSKKNVKHSSRRFAGPESFIVTLVIHFSIPYSSTSFCEHDTAHLYGTTNLNRASQCCFSFLYRRAETRALAYPHYMRTGFSRQTAIPRFLHEK